MDLRKDMLEAIVVMDADKLADLAEFIGFLNEEDNGDTIKLFARIKRPYSFVQLDNGLVGIVKGD